MKYKVGEILSYMGSTSLGVIIHDEELENLTREDQVWIKPICGTDKWMNTKNNAWLVDMKNLRNINDSEKELLKLLFSESL